MNKPHFVIELLNTNKSYYFVDFSENSDCLVWTGNILNAYPFVDEQTAAEFIVDYIEPRQAVIVEVTKQLIKDRLK